MRRLGLVFIDCCDKSKFLELTGEEFYKLVDRVAAAVGTMTKADFTRLEKATGINYNPDGVIFDLELRAFIDVIASTTFDWMHVFLCSGGAMQFEFFRANDAEQCWVFGSATSERLSQRCGPSRAIKQASK